MHVRDSTVQGKGLCLSALVVSDCIMRAFPAASSTPLVAVLLLCIAVTEAIARSQHLRTAALPDAEPKIADLLVATFVPDNATEIHLQRMLMRDQMMQAEQLFNHSLTLQHVFVLCKGSALEASDIVHVDCPESYQDLFLKAYNFWTSISTLIPAKHYVKRDSDAHICWRPVLDRFVKHDKQNPSLYMGGYTFNADIYHDPGHRWHDRFVTALAPGQNRYWPFMQGAFYAISADLVQSFANSKDRLQMFAMEDTMIGAWLLPVRKQTYKLAMEHGCHCEFRDFDVFHKCSTSDMLSRCLSDKYVRNCL